MLGTVLTAGGYLFNYGINAARTWGPREIANQTIEKSTTMGAQILGDNVLGNGLGTIAGYAIAPYVAQMHSTMPGNAGGVTFVANQLAPVVLYHGGRMAYQWMQQPQEKGDRS